MAALTTANHWKRSQCVWFRSSDSFDVVYLFNGEPTYVIRDNIVTVEIVGIRISASFSGHMANPFFIIATALYRSFIFLGGFKTWHSSLLQRFSAGKKCELLAIYWWWIELNIAIADLAANLEIYYYWPIGDFMWRFLSPLQDVFVCVCVCPLSLTQS